MKNKISESFEVGDLHLVLDPKIHLDEFRSKLGNDADNIVVSFLLNSKEAATDLVSFLEMGYSYVLDADISASEIKPGSYLVFVEFLRRRRVIQQIFRIINDLSAASQLNIKDWTFKYMNEENKHPLTTENLKKIVPLYPKAYKDRYEKPIENLKTLSGINNESKNVYDDDIRQLMFASGIKNIL
jgi:hypothetical protein